MTPVPSKSGSPSTTTGLHANTLAPKLHDEPKLTLTQERLDGPDDSEFTADLYPLTNLERPLLRQVTR